MPPPTLADQPASPAERPHDHLYNLVVLPVSAPGPDGPSYQVSAGRIDRGARMVSGAWSEADVRSALAGLGLPPGQAGQLLRGNRMVHGGRDARYVFFTKEELTAAGLTPWTPATEEVGGP